MKPTNLEDVVHYEATHENQFVNRNLNDLHNEFPNDFLVIMDPNVLLVCKQPKKYSNPRLLLCVGELKSPQDRGE